MFRRCLARPAVVAFALAGAFTGGGRGPSALRAQSPSSPATPIEHLVVIVQDGKSFDSYFGTYPRAANPPGSLAFSADPATPSVNGLSAALLNDNPNLAGPFRIDRARAYTCAINDGYVAGQQAADAGLLDSFVEVGAAPTPAPASALQYCPADAAGRQITPMGYYDGNTVSSLWNYAQHFAMSDNSFASSFGPSTIGALNLVAGDASGILCAPAASVFGSVPLCGADNARPPLAAGATGMQALASVATGTLYTEADPYWDACSTPDPAQRAASSRRTIGDLLNDAGVTWGWFQAGFAPGPDGGCNMSQHPQLNFDLQNGIDPASDPHPVPDYIPHHEPFQYFASTANPRHLPPSAPTMIGQTDQANHQYDLASFWDAAAARSMPAVSFLKAPHYQDGQPGESNPIDEQRFISETINRLQTLPEWNSTAVVIAWSGAGGFYDHVAGPTVNRSYSPLDFACGTVSDGPSVRCGYGPRLPLLVISPFAKRNEVSHTLSDQNSVTRLIEDNWLDGGRISDSSFDSQAGSLLDMFDFSGPRNRQLLLDPFKGEPVAGP